VACVLYLTGQRYVVPVSGFFCKLCHKFYNNEAAAKVAHCQSETHFERLKVSEGRCFTILAIKYFGLWKL
jgi:hypothetical protein